MFKCQACAAKDSEIEHLRGLVSRYMMTSNPMLYHLEDNRKAATGYYGDGNDDLEIYDEMGNKSVINEQDLNERPLLK